MTREIVVVAGARPNFVKVAPILHEFQRRPLARVELVHTGQHYDATMSGVFFDQLGIRAPDAHLQVGSGSHAKQTAAVMSAFDDYLDARAKPPDDVVVVGDVNSTMACALVAAKRQLAVTHVEAGLRSFDRTMPEEINRIVTDSISSLLLVSEPSGLTNLAREGVAPERTRFVGNVMIDTLVAQLPFARALDMRRRLGLLDRYVVVTLHRPSNVDESDRLTQLVEVLRELSTTVTVVFPIHPRTELRLGELGLRSRLESEAIKLSPPLGYREFLGLVSTASAVITDSGGVQEETSYLDIPCVTMRENTERPVTTTQGTNRLVGNDYAAALAAVQATVDGNHRHAVPIDGWDGHAALRIVDAILDRR